MVYAGLRPFCVGAIHGLCWLSSVLCWSNTWFVLAFVRSVLGQYMVYAGPRPFCVGAIDGLLKDKQHEEVVLMLALGINPSNG